VADPRRDEFPNNFVGDLVHTDRGWVVRAADMLPGRPRLRRARLLFPEVDGNGNYIPGTTRAFGGLVRLRKAT